MNIRMMHLAYPKNFFFIKMTYFSFKVHGGWIFKLVSIRVALKAQMNSKSEFPLMFLSTCRSYQLLAWNTWAYFHLKEHLILQSSVSQPYTVRFELVSSLIWYFLLSRIQNYCYWCMSGPGQVEVTSLQQRVCRVTGANSGKMSLCSENALAPCGQLSLFYLSVPPGLC